MHIIGDLDKWISYFPAATVSLIPVCRGNELAEPWNLAWDTYIIHHSEQLVTLIYLFIYLFIFKVTSSLCSNAVLSEDHF